MPITVIYTLSLHDALPICIAPEFPSNQVILAQVLPGGERRLNDGRRGHDLFPSLFLVQKTGFVAPAAERNISRAVPSDEALVAQLGEVLPDNLEGVDRVPVQTGDGQHRLAVLIARLRQSLSQHHKCPVVPSVIKGLKSLDQVRAIHDTPRILHGGPRDRRALLSSGADSVVPRSEERRVGKE